MIKKEPRLRTIVQINMRFITAGLALFYGWLCWQWTSPEWWGLGLTAILMFVAGGTAIIATVFKVVAMVLRNREIDAFNRQGGKVRADPMAREHDLKRGGIIR